MVWVKTRKKKSMTKQAMQTNKKQLPKQMNGICSESEQIQNRF